ncbi:MAG: serine protease [Polyangiaceae bacterium]
MATAGHCVPDQATCDTTNVVFGFSADANGQNERTSIPRSDVYACVAVVAQVYAGLAGDDWALLRVDRSVTNRTPLSVRRTGSVPNDAQLVMFGHPLLLPLKATLNGAVRGDNIASTPKFQTTLDASPGNSGSPVLNLQTGQVEGILTSGPTPEFQAVVRNGASCATATVCSDVTGCPSFFYAWTEVSRISGVVAALEGRSCFDKLRNGQETDVDCGGPECTPCAQGHHCALDRDCPFRSVCQNSVCVAGPQCVVASDCLDPVAPACLRATCVNNGCNVDYSACGCRTNADCDDGRSCTQDLCFARTLSCIHIESGCEAPCTEATATDLGAPGNATVVRNDGCVRVRDGYPFWWGNARKLMLQTNGSGTYPVPFSWTNTCAGSSGSGQFTANWQKQYLTPTSSACSTLIDLKGNGGGNVSLWYFGE